LRISYFRQSSFISINQLWLSWDFIVSCLSASFHSTNDCSQGTLQEYPLAIRLKIVTGNYILQSDKAAFSKKSTSPICLLCKKPEETTTSCIILLKIGVLVSSNFSHTIRKWVVVSSGFLHKRQIGLVDFFENAALSDCNIINPFAYVAGDEDTNLTVSISNSLEPICRQLL
jgi:hypothetical protein